MNKRGPGADRRRAGKSRAGRTLHLVDLPNLVGRAHDDVFEYRGALSRYLVASAWRPGDHVVLGVTAACARQCVGYIHAPFLLRWARGHHASTRALLSFARDPRQLARSYDRLVLGSGDRRLAPLARVAAGHGVRIDVVALEGQLSRALAGLAVRSVRLPAPRRPMHRDLGTGAGKTVQRVSAIAPTPLSPAIVFLPDAIASSGVSGLIDRCPTSDDARARRERCSAALALRVAG